MPEPSPWRERRGLIAFFVLTFLITWSPQVAVLLAGLGEEGMGIAGLGIFGPLVAAILVATLGRDGGLRGLFGPLLRWRVSPSYYLIALTLPAALLAAGMAAVSFVSDEVDGPYLFYPRETTRIVALFLVPFVEEVGWRGYALPRLIRVFGALRASLVLGVIWAVWHLPMLVLAGMPLALFPAMVVFFTAGSVVFTWLFQRTRGSLLLAVLLHVGAHLANSHLPLPDYVPALAHTVAFLLCAMVLVFVDRGAFGSVPAGPSRVRAPTPTDSHG